LRRYFSGYTLLGDFIVEEFTRESHGWLDTTEQRRVERVERLSGDRPLAMD